MALKRTSRNGEPPGKKINVIVKTKREAYVPNAENQRKTAEYESALAKNKAIEDKYKSDVETYGKQMKAYEERPKYSGKRDIQTKFSGGGRELSASELAEWNKRKSGERAGLTAKKVYVAKDYSSDKEYKGYFYEDMNKPTAPTKQKTPTVEKPKLAIERMPMDKLVSISTDTPRPTRMALPEEKEKWQAPGRNLVSVEKTFYTRSGKEKTRTPISKAVENVKRKVQYKQELKQGKAYFGGFEGQNAGDISETKKGLKQQIKEVRKGTARHMESLNKRERIQGYKSELKQAKQAGKYIKNLGNEFTMSGATAGENIKRVGPNAEVVAKKTGRIRFATPETFKDYRPSTDNPANRNKTFGRKP